MTIAFFLSRVKDVMIPCPQLTSPATTLQQAARKMAVTACGALPVGTPEKFHGLLTDSGIIVHAIARSKNPSKEIAAGYLTDETADCYENDTLECAAEIMHQRKTSRLIVKNRHGTVTGILSFEHILRNDIRPEEMAHIVKHAIEPIFI